MKKIKALLASVMMLASMIPYGMTGVTAAEQQSLNGIYLIRNVNSGIYLNVSDKNVQQWEADYAKSNNVWKLESDSDGYYKIYSMSGNGNSCLTVDNGSKSSGDNISISKDADNDSQLYKLSANADGSFKILTKCSDNTQSVEVKNADTENGANVQQWEINGFNCQDWELIPIKYADNSSLTETKGQIIGNVYIPGDINDDKVVDVFDVIALRRIVSGLDTANEQQLLAGNVNGDDKIDSKDVSAIQKFIVKSNDDLIGQTSDILRKYAAIDGEFTEGVVESTNAGFESEAYLNLDNKSGIEASWNVAAESDGVYSFDFRYANGGNASRNVAIYVNNQLTYWETEFAPTGAWTNWENEIVNLPLKKGVNMITIVSLTSDGAPNIDTITVQASDKAADKSTPIEPIVGKPDSITDENPDGRRMESLDRGVVAAYTGSGMLVSWRSLATDPDNTSFKLYKNGTFVADIGAADATNYFVKDASATDTFTIDTYVNGTMTEKAQTAIILGNKNGKTSGAYMDIAIDKPADQTMPDGTTCTYMPNDCSLGDVDGDGQYEIFLKWYPSNAKDSGDTKPGYTGTVFIDCYKLDGTKLWRIDLGKNIRAGAHYTQFMVYDFDGDGKAEMMCKTSDGTYDGKGKCIGIPTADYRDSNGRILTGNEYLTLFDGLTGAALDTIDYEPGRGNLSDAKDKTYFGDNWGNRCERYLAGVAYLNGKTPSAIFARGYYARTAIAAYDIVDKKIVKHWYFDTMNDSSNPYYGQGNHSLVVMDVDSDGKDEIVYGSCCIDDNGQGLWSTKLGHGDCMQAGDLIPERPGLEIFQVHEEVYCAEIHDAATGEILWRVDGLEDVGRGIALNISADYPGMEFASTADGMVYGYNPNTGNIESLGFGWNDKIKWSMNSAVWWTGDLERESLDRTMVENFNGRIFTGDGVTWNNGTKSNACITCDLFGDWREEMIFSVSDGTALRVFETTYTTDIKLFTLMHDSQYRTGVAIENVAYNQAPNTSFFLGTGYALPEKPQIYTAKSN